MRRRHWRLNRKIKNFTKRRRKKKENIRNLESESNFTEGKNNSRIRDGNKVEIRGGFHTHCVGSGETAINFIVGDKRECQI